MKLILTDEIEYVAPGVMLFTKQRLAEILEFIKDDGELTRAAEHRNEADASIREACPDHRHDYYTAFLSYIYCPYCGQRLLS